MNTGVFHSKGVPAEVWRFLQGLDEWVSGNVLEDFAAQFNAQQRGRWQLEWHERGTTPFPTLTLVHVHSRRTYEYSLLRDDVHYPDGPHYHVFTGRRVE